MNIRDHVREAISGGLDATITQRDGVAGVLFHDEGEFISFDDLNVNSVYGYFKMSLFPNVTRDCTNENPETIHHGADYDEWKPIIWADSGGNLALIGDPHQAADLYQALGAYLRQGVVDAEEISEDDPAWGQWRTMAWAIIEYRDYMREVDFDVMQRADDQIGNTIRAAARAGRIPRARQDAQGRWLFMPPAFRGWLVKTAEETRGRQ